MILPASSPVAVVLIEPRIPQNTGNIARLCACAGAELFLVGDLGFRLGDKYLKRAGMDYLDLEGLEIGHFDSFEALLETKKDWHVYYLSTKARQSYTQPVYPRNTLLVFGREDKGLPDWIMEDYPDQSLRIPMSEGSRSLNLATSASIVLYEVLRQWQD